MRVQTGHLAPARSQRQRRTQRVDRSSPHGSMATNRRTGRWCGSAGSFVAGADTLSAMPDTGRVWARLRQASRSVVWLLPNAGHEYREVNRAVRLCCEVPHQRPEGASVSDRYPEGRDRARGLGSAKPNRARPARATPRRRLPVRPPGDLLKLPDVLPDAKTKPPDQAPCRTRRIARSAAGIGRVARLVRLRRGVRAMPLAVAGPPVPCRQRLSDCAASRVAPGAAGRPGWPLTRLRRRTTTSSNRADEMSGVASARITHAMAASGRTEEVAAAVSAG